MVKKIFLEIISEYKWSDLLKFMLIVMLFGTINLTEIESNYLDWLSIILCWLAIQFYNFADFLLMGNRFPNVFFYVPQGSKGQKGYLRCRILVETMIFFSFSLLYTLIRGIIAYFVLDKKVVGYFIGAHPLLEMMQTILLIGFLFWYCSSVNCKRLTGQAQGLTKWWSIALHYGMLFVNILAIYFISLKEQAIEKGQPSAFYNIWIVSFFVLSLLHLFWYSRHSMKFMLSEQAK